MEERPSLYGQEVTSLVAADIFPKVLEWLKGFDSKDPAFSDEEEMAHLRKQVQDAVEDGMYDSYQTAKYLDNLGWAVNSELVELFEEASWSAYRHHEKLVAEWVAKNSIKPELAVGDRATFRAQLREYEGEVIEISDKTAQYTIFCEALGHVRRGLESRQGISRYGCIIPFEDTKRAS